MMQYIKAHGLSLTAKITRRAMMVHLQKHIPRRMRKTTSRVMEELIQNLMLAPTLKIMRKFILDHLLSHMKRTTVRITLQLI